MACSYKAQGAKRKTPSRPRCAKASAGCWKPICGNSKSRARRAGIYEACLSSILVSILLSVYRFSPSIDLSMYQFTYLSLSLCSSWLLSNHLSLPISVSMSAAHLHLYLFVDRYLYLCLSLALSLTLTLILCLSLALSLGLQCGLRGECGLKLSLLHVIAAVLSICRSMSRASSGPCRVGTRVRGCWVMGDTSPNHNRNSLYRNPSFYYIGCWVMGSRGFRLGWMSPYPVEGAGCPGRVFI